MHLDEQLRRFEGLGLTPEITRDRGIWIVRYTHDGKSHSLIHTDLSGEEIAQHINNHLSENQIKMVRWHGQRVTYSPGFITEFRDELSELIWDETDSLRVLVALNVDRDELMLDFKRKMYDFAHGSLTLPKGEALLKYSFDTGCSTNDREPTSDEIAFLNKLSKYKPEQ